jgi:thioredoxin-like negative regulator of GroEL
VSVVKNSHIRLVDCECETELADKFKVGLCPTFVLTVDGRAVERWEGYPGRELMAKRYIEAVKGLK